MRLVTYAGFFFLAILFSHVLQQTHTHIHKKKETIHIDNILISHYIAAALIKGFDPAETFFVYLAGHCGTKHLIRNSQKYQIV